MGARTRYEPGTFSWVELFTTDPDDAKRFYGELFGWQTEGASATATQGGKAVAAISEQAAPQRSVGVPPHWLSYVTVASAESGEPPISAARCTPVRSTWAARGAWRSWPIPRGRCSGSGNRGARSVRSSSTIPGA